MKRGVRGGKHICIGLLVATTIALPRRVVADDTNPTEPSQEAKPELSVGPEQERARAFFQTGLTLLRDRRFEAALIEFRKANEAFATRAATENAAVCLRELGRFDEAHATFQRVLEFPDVPNEVLERIRPQLQDLEKRTGLLLLAGGEAGAQVSVDGVPRGRLPLAEPLRITTGVRMIRVHADGFIPYVQAIEVTPGSSVELRPKLEVLARAGRLKVSVKGGADANLIVDGVVVGPTPWSGALAPGEHAVWLKGRHGDGSAPARVNVLLGQLTETELRLQPLEAELTVATRPADAAIRINGVLVGTTKFNASLPRGSYEITVSREGFVEQTRTQLLVQDTRQTVTVELAPDEPIGTSVRSDRIEFGALVGVPILPSWLDRACDQICTQNPAVGAHIEATGTYRFANGFGVGLSAGYLRVESGYSLLATEHFPAGRPTQTVRESADIALSAGTIAGHASMRVGEDFFGRFQAGAGAAFGAARYDRAFETTDSGGRTIGAGPYATGDAVVALQAAGSLEAGFVAGVVELALGARFVGLFPLIAPDGGRVLVPAGSDGAATLAQSPILAGALLGVAPTASLLLSLDP